jgi:hypothetical protein|tara:strand:- start:6086 stop:6544 length:459 start_codon:yes stop_codon:yes gene_type:complete
MNLRNDANDDVSARASPRRAHRDDVAGGDDGSRLLVVVSPRAVDGDGEIRDDGDDGEIRDDGDDDEREDAIEGEDDDADVVDAGGTERRAIERVSARARERGGETVDGPDDRGRRRRRRRARRTPPTKERETGAKRARGGGRKANVCVGRWV